ncbi:hypothetical protein GGF46_001704 [Coemansia sp. RSA 552]|nr:hypothetical protein GGF46_001704 [Coemansia sp. RSA 552]
MHSARTLLRARGTLSLTRRAFAGTLRMPAMAIRLNSTLVPKNMQPRAEELAEGTVKTVLGELDSQAVPDNVRSELWELNVATLKRMNPGSAWPPKKRALHWILLNAESREELDMALKLTEQWRMHTLPITQATTHIWAQACVRFNYPEPFVTMLMDRWRYRQLPVSHTLAYFIRFLGLHGARAEESERALDDAFRVFALYPYYGLVQDAQAYGALVEACCEINTEEAWRRALVASEESLAFDPPKITYEALAALEKRSTERSEPEMADRYKGLIGQLGLKPANRKDLVFDEDGNLVTADS